MALVEPLLIAWLDHDLALDTRTETPDDLQDRLPMARVMRIGGGDDTFRLDHPAVDIDVFHTTRLSAARLADQVRESLYRLQRHGAFGAAVVTEVATRAGPRWLPYDNTSLRRYGATYRLAVHDA